jgi:hypothetical protein
MMANAMFQWQCHPKAENALVNLLESASAANPFISTLQQDLLKITSTRLFDWLDHILVGYSQKLEKELEDAGFVSEAAKASYRVLHHPGAQLPRVVMRDEEGGVLGIAVSVDSIADFLLVRGLSGFIEGTPLAEYRRCCVSTENGVSLWAVERRASHMMEPVSHDSKYIEKYLEAKELYETRPRDLEDEDAAMSFTLTLANKLIELVGEDLAAWIVLEVERKYWQSRNAAGQVQKNRQDRVGMGWANHDHHTFRSSRKHFIQLVRLFEMLGFYCRERFYAGKEAGWGAQVMEHPHSRLVLFLDVDLEEHEIQIDFRHQTLPELDRLGTVGLWCALHGDSILRSGMHHLEAQFMFEELTKDLSTIGVGMMEPFSSFPFLRQAFTKGEMWPVPERRLQNLLDKRLITPEQAEKFRTKGAVGSHMENLQRREGYKGFNQKNVSYIIQHTDPRNINF